MASSEKVFADGAVRLNVDGDVASVTLARPERRNAMTPAIWHGLARIGASLPQQVRVVVVRGEGPSFCAGIDLKLLAGTAGPGDQAVARAQDEDFEQQVAGYQAGYLWLTGQSIVSIAAVQGHAIGAGFQLALACDLRILADDAKLCMKEPALGLVPDLTGTKPLVDIVGLPRALEMCLTTRTVGAAEALGLRLAELVVPAAELDAAVATWSPRCSRPTRRRRAPLRRCCARRAAIPWSSKRRRNGGPSGAAAQPAAPG